MGAQAIIVELNVPEFPFPQGTISRFLSVEPKKKIFEEAVCEVILGNTIYAIIFLKIIHE